MRVNREERRGKIQNERLFKEKNLDLVQDSVLSLLTHALQFSLCGAELFWHVTPRCKICQH